VKSVYPEEGLGTSQLRRKAESGGSVSLRTGTNKNISGVFGHGWRRTVSIAIRRALPFRSLNDDQLALAVNPLGQNRRGDEKRGKRAVQGRASAIWDNDCPARCEIESVRERAEWTPKHFLSRQRGNVISWGDIRCSQGHIDPRSARVKFGRGAEILHVPAAELRAGLTEFPDR